jgi:hypothetical protein
MRSGLNNGALFETGILRSNIDCTFLGSIQNWVRF